MKCNKCLRKLCDIILCTYDYDYNAVSSLSLNIQVLIFAIMNGINLNIYCLALISFC